MGHWSLIVPFNIHQALPATPFVPGSRPEELGGILALPGMAQCSPIPQKQTQELVSRRPWWLRWSITCWQHRRHGFYPRHGKIPWRRKWLPTPVENPMDRGAWWGLWSTGSKTDGHGWRTKHTDTIHVDGYVCKIFFKKWTTRKI